MVSCVVFIIWSNGKAPMMPMSETSRKVPPIITENTESILGMWFSFPAPYFCANKIERPSVNPVIAVRNRLMTVVVEPIAASAFSPAILPTINASAQL